MSKAHERSRSARSRYAGRTGLGIALAATTAVGVTVPAAGAHAAPAGNVPTTLHNLGATALSPVARISAPAAVPAAPVMTYRVQAGDTVSHIALRTGTSVSSIIQANNLNSRALIRVGQVLSIPSPAGASATAESTRPSTTPASRSRSAATHTVRSGDTVSALAKEYGTTVSAIIAANDLNAQALIRVGDRLTIPGSATSPSSSSGSGSSSSSPSTSNPSSAPASSTASAHTVRSGDTVSAIAKKYGTTVSAIVKANGLNSRALIRVGERLTIPGSATSPSSSASGSSNAGTTAPVSNPVASPTETSGSTHTVRSGDTVSALAKRYGTTVSKIREANSLSSVSLIFVGQKLVIPGQTSASAPSGEQLVPDSFLGRTYPEATVSAANANKAALLAMNLPSRAQMQQMVIDVARQMGVDPVLAQAHAYQESGFNHASVSPANAVGTMQVIPMSGEWASDLVGRQLDLLDPHDNVVAGVAIIRQLVRTSDDLDTAIASYYQGAGSVSRNGMFDDTERYVAAIRAHMANFGG